MKRLKTDYIDIYQIQWPNPNIPIEETISGDELELVDAGKSKIHWSRKLYAIDPIKRGPYNMTKLNKLCVSPD